MKNKFSPRDWEQRLNSTICRYKGQPVYVSVDDGELYISKGAGSRYYRIPYDDSDLDISTPPLGYVNFKDKETEKNVVLYCTRSTGRRYKQGLCKNSLVVYGIDRKKSRISGNLIFKSSNLFETINGNFPSLTEILRKQEDDTATAVSRNVALCRNKIGVTSVYYKTEMVGWIAPDSDIVHVPTSSKAEIVSRFLSPLDWRID